MNKEKMFVVKDYDNNEFKIFINKQENVYKLI